eukprot:COSAG01_NODE_6102_length_3849_cov_17.469333_2_plen_130_part_00
MGGRSRNLPLPSGKDDPGCILRFRARLGVCKSFTREETEPRGSWHQTAVLSPTTSMRAAAAAAGIEPTEIRFSSAHSAGCPCCPRHGDDCPGSPKKGAPNTLRHHRCMRAVCAVQIIVQTLLLVLLASR